MSTITLVSPSRSITRLISPAGRETQEVPGQIASIGPNSSSSSPNVHRGPVLDRSKDFVPFDTLLEQHRDMCTKRASRMLHNRSDVPDAVQSAFRKAFQCRHQFHGDGTFSAWLGRIVENECLMRLRSEKNKHFVPLEAPTDSLVRFEIVGSLVNPEDELGWKEVVKVLRKEMLGMPPVFRDVMLLHDGKQMPMPDVAERLGLSVPAAKSRLSRARRELRLRMSRHCGRKGPGTLLEKAAYNRLAYARSS